MSIKAAVQFDNRLCSFIGDVTLPKHSGADAYSGVHVGWYFYALETNSGIFFSQAILQMVVFCVILLWR